MHKFKSRSTQNVIGIKLSGKLTREEYQDIVPILEEKIAQFGKIRLLVELDHWEGWGPYAALNDIVFVFKNSLKIERVAFLVKSKDDRNAILIDQPFSPWFRDSTRYFSIKEKEAAWRWVGEGIEGLNLPEDDIDPADSVKEKKIKYGPNMDVLIVGAGVSGLTLAAVLQSRGFSPRIVEAAEYSPIIPRMLTLWPSAMGVFKSLGLYKKIRKHTTQFHAFSLFDQTGQPIQIFDNTHLEEQFGNTYMIPHHHLIHLLSDHVDSESFRYETAATRVKPSEDGVKVNFSDGTKATYDCVICADGIHSKLRELLFQNFSTSYTGWSSWSFILTPDFNLPTETFAYKSNDQYIQFIASEGKLHVFAALKSSEVPSKKSNHIKTLQSSFTNFPEFATKSLGCLSKSTPIHFQPFFDIQQEERIQERIALVGQAAFNYPLTSFFGDTSTIESAYMLADELSRSDTKTIKSSLKKYEQRCVSRFLNKDCSPPDIVEFNSSSDIFENFWKDYLEIPF